MGKTLKSPSMSSTMNESGFVFNAENPSPSPQSNKCAEFIHPLIMNSPANCSFDSSSQVLKGVLKVSTPFEILTPVRMETPLLF